MAPSDAPPTFYLLKHRLPSSESSNLLGRVIRQFQDPTFDYTPTSPSNILTSQIYTSFLLPPQYDTTTSLTTRATRDDRFLARIKGLLTLSNDSSHGGTTSITSPRVTTRRLKLERDYFTALKSHADTRRKILEICPVGSKAYLVVGTMSIQTASFKTTGEQRQSGKAETTIPLSAAATAGLTGIPAGIPGTDPHLGIERSNSAQWTREYTTDSTTGTDSDAEEVFAICCREITRDWAGLGADVRMKTKQAEYRGGQHFGSKSKSKSKNKRRGRSGDDSDDSSDEDEDIDEEGDKLAAEGLKLATDAPRPAQSNDRSGKFGDQSILIFKLDDGSDVVLEF